MTVLPLRNTRDHGPDHRVRIFRKRGPFRYFDVASPSRRFDTVLVPFISYTHLLSACMLCFPNLSSSSSSYSLSILRDPNLSRKKLFLRTSCFLFSLFWFCEKVLLFVKIAFFFFFQMNWWLFSEVGLAPSDGGGDNGDRRRSCGVSVLRVGSEAVRQRRGRRSERELLEIDWR